MNLLGPIPLQTVALVAGIVGSLIVVAYILKMRRRRYEVPFSKLWQRVLREKDATSLWRRLKRLISLLVQLAFIALLLGAALDPRLGQAAASGRNVVVIIDASASMKAIDDGGRARIEHAKSAARDLLRGLGGADVAMLVRMDGQTTPLTRFDSDTVRLIQVVDGIFPSDTPADLHRALEAAADALRGRKDPMIVVIGDGAYADDARERVTWQPMQEAVLGIVDLSGVDVRFIPVGKEARNVGIVAFNVRRYLQNKLSYEVLVEIMNFGTEPENVKLTLFAGDDPISVKTVPLAPGERLREIYPELGGGDSRALRAHLQPLDPTGAALPDAFALDDDAWALLPERTKQKVLVVTQNNLYLDGALLLDRNVVADKVLPAAYDAKQAATYDVVIFDGWNPPDGGVPASRGAIYFRPDDKGPVAIRGEVSRPPITEVEDDHPVTRWVTLSDVNTDTSHVFTPAEGDVVLAKSVRDPLVVAGRRAGRKFLAFGFGLDATDLTLRVAFPVLMVNALDWFAGDDAELITTYRTGHTWAIPVDDTNELREVSIRGPEGLMKAPVQEGRARFYGQHVGIYDLDPGPDREMIAVAANLADPFESNIKPAPELALGGKVLAGAPTFATSLSRSIWIYLVLAALVLTAVEWLTYNRRITV